MAKKKTMAEIEEKCTNNDIEFLDLYYISTSYLHNVRCMKCGHFWKIRINDVGRYGCLPCSNKLKSINTKKPFSEVLKTFNTKNLNILDDFYVNSQTPINTECLNCDYTWKVSYNAIQQGGNCPRCAGKLKHTLEEINILYAKIGLIFLDKVYIKNDFPHNTQCMECCYNWKLRYQDARKGHGCPRCGQSLKYTLEQIQEIFKKINLDFLDISYKNKDTKHTIKCLTCFLVFKKNIGAIINGHSGCPFCTRGLDEKITIKFAEDFFKLKINKKTFKMPDCDFQKKCIVDGYFCIGTKEIIIEYNGGQHYYPVNFAGNWQTTNKNFERQTKRDRWLKNFCNENKILLLEVDGRSYKGLQIQDYLKNKFVEYNLDLLVN